jgi:hypothetical protein
VTHSILEVLATKPDWTAATPLSMDELGPYLFKHYRDDHERRARHKLRDELYRDGGCQYMKAVLDNQFEHINTQTWRRKWVPHARFGNLLKQVIRNTSSVYQEPATRKVGGTEQNEAQYAAHVKALKLDGKMDYANRMLNLHRVVLLGPRVRRDLDGKGTLVLDVATPANVIAVVHPNDSTLVIAWLIEQDFKSARTDFTRDPKWQLWSDHEVGYLDKDFVPIGQFKEHGLGINPWLAVSYHAEAIPGFWPGEDGEDLVAAQVSIWFTGIQMLKETTSATKQEIVTGNTSMAARGVAADTNETREYPEGVTSQVVDRSMDPDLFIKPSDHIEQRAANGYGLSKGALRHDMQSADAQEAQAEPLRKIRREQVKTFREAEGGLAIVMAQVLAVDAPDVAFVVVAFGVDFGEPQVLMSPERRLDLFLKMRAAGLFSTVEFLKLLNPDLEDDEAAWKMLDKFIKDETKRVRKMRELQALSGSMGEQGPGENPQAGVPQGPVAMRGEGPEGDDYAWVEEMANAA